MAGWLNADTPMFLEEEVHDVELVPGDSNVALVVYQGSRWGPAGVPVHAAAPFVVPSLCRRPGLGDAKP